MNLKKIAVVMFAVILTASLFLAGCAQDKKALEKEEGAPETITITDQFGREVTVPKEINRVIAYGPPVLRDVVILGSADKVVGTDEHSVEHAVHGTCFYVYAHPELADLPIVGVSREPNMEAMVVLKPDIIFNFESWVDSDLIQEQTGIPTIGLIGVEDWNAADFHKSYEPLRIIAKVLGKEDRAEWLISYVEDKLDRIREIIDQIPQEEKPRVYALIAHGISSAAVYAPVEWAGGYNVAEEYLREHDLQYAEIDPEYVLHLDPDVIFLGGTVDELIEAHPGLEATSAVKKGQVYQLFGPSVKRELIQVVAETYYIAKILHPDLFQDLDVEKEANKMFKEVYGVDDLYNKVQEARGRELYRWE